MTTILPQVQNQKKQTRTSTNHSASHCRTLIFDWASSVQTDDFATRLQLEAFFNFFLSFDSWMKKKRITSFFFGGNTSHYFFFQVCQFLGYSILLRSASFFMFASNRILSTIHILNIVFFIRSLRLYMMYN